MHSQLTTALRDRVIAYALGLLSGSESERFEQHLEGGCPACQSELRIVRESLATIPLSSEPVAPAPRLRERLLQMIDAVRSPNPSQPPVEILAPCVVRASEPGWEPSGFKGVTSKRLHLDRDADRVTMLVRMEPGASYPAHRHHAGEHCFVLEGDLTNNLALSEGDYAFNPANSQHPVTRTERGCLLLIVTSACDEIIT